MTPATPVTAIADLPTIIETVDPYCSAYQTTYGAIPQQKPTNLCIILSNTQEITIYCRGTKLNTRISSNTKISPRRNNLGALHLVRQRAGDYSRACVSKKWSTLNYTQIYTHPKRCEIVHADVKSRYDNFVD